MKPYQVFSLCILVSFNIWNSWRNKKGSLSKFNIPLWISSIWTTTNHKQTPCNNKQRITEKFWKCVWKASTEVATLNEDERESNQASQS